ncbi:MAG: substrate-binding domain-containing protein [Candidatus Limivivens sp.]|nr:substrate-binding domain-containing protein [Candidatus Limivivens sp.]
MKKKLLALAMAGAMLAGISTTACAEEGDWVIGYICKDLSQEWFQGTLNAIEDTALSMGAKEVIALDCEMNPEKCLNNLDNLIAQNVDIIIICTPDQELSQTIVDRCDAAEIPVFADADGLIVDGKHIAPALELNAYVVGSGMGEWLANYVNTEMDLAADAESIGYMRMTMNEVSSCVPRAEGAKDSFLAGCPDFDESRIIDANYDGTTEAGYDVAAATITAHPEITKWLVTAPNDEGAAGATRALEAASLDGEACVVGAGAYIAKDEFKKDYSCFKAAAYFSSTETGTQEATAAIEYLRDGKEIFGDYKDTYEGDNEYGTYPLGGIMVDPTNYEEVMGADAE